MVAAAALVLVAPLGLSFLSAEDADESVVKESAEGEELMSVHPGPPGRTLTLLFIHHSCGRRLMADNLEELLEQNNYKVYHATRGSSIGEDTDAQDFQKSFGEHWDEMKSWGLPEGQEHDIIMFKSCYHVSNIESDEMLENYKKWYAPMVELFKAHPEKLFIPMAQPPLNGDSEMFNLEAGARARIWTDYLEKEYCSNLANVQSFNWFDILADPDTNASKVEYRLKEGNSHPNPLANHTTSECFIPWINRAVRTAGLVE